VSNILGMILIGFLVGAVAKFILPGRDPGGWIITTLLGIGGAVAASHLGKLLNVYPAEGLPSFISAVAGAVILLLLYRIIKR